MEFVDLHCHSTCSDGTNSPQELVSMAVKLQLAGLALTDHDTVSGINDFLCHGKAQGLQVISGVELSANFNKTPLHILGYGFDHQNSSFLSDLIEIQQSRETRNRAITHKLQSLGLKIDYEGIVQLAGGGQVGRPHFATFLVQHKKANNLQHAFDLFLRKDRPAYIARRILHAEHAIRMITQAGGIAILAHPGSLKQEWQKLNITIAKLARLGLGGVESYYPTHSESFRKKLTHFCNDHNLIITGGSDFHGNIRPGTRLGSLQKKQRTPLNVLIELKKHLEQNHT